MKIRISSCAIILVAILSLNINCSKKDNPPDPVTDIEGNSYKTVRIGEQVWMAENLTTSTFSDGTEIPDVTDAGSWYELTIPGFCWYDNDEAANKETYGALYNYYSVISGNLCPAGWHVPLGKNGSSSGMFQVIQLPEVANLRKRGRSTGKHRTPEQ